MQEQNLLSFYYIRAPVELSLNVPQELTAGNSS